MVDGDREIQEVAEAGGGGASEQKQKTHGTKKQTQDAQDKNKLRGTWRPEYFGRQRGY